MSEQVKSNAPWILGIVGISLTVFHFVCAVMCSAALVGATSLSDSASAKDVGDNSMNLAYASIVLFVVCFILSFFGKSNYSKITGIIMILCGIIAILFCSIHFSLPGVAASVLFIIAGALSITNHKKVAAA